MEEKEEGEEVGLVVLVHWEPSHIFTRQHDLNGQSSMLQPPLQNVSTKERRREEKREERRRRKNKREEGRRRKEEKKLIFGSLDSLDSLDSLCRGSDYAAKRERREEGRRVGRRKRGREREEVPRT